MILLRNLRYLSQSNQRIIWFCLTMTNTCSNLSSSKSMDVLISQENSHRRKKMIRKRMSSWSRQNIYLRVLALFVVQPHWIFTWPAHWIFPAGNRFGVRCNARCRGGSEHFVYRVFFSCAIFNSLFYVFWDIYLFVSIYSYYLVIAALSYYIIQ